MKNLILLIALISSSAFAENLECYRNIDKHPIYKIDLAKNEIFYFKSNGEYEKRDSSKCAFNEESVSCNWFKHWMSVDLNQLNGKMTLIAPPGWTWDIQCYATSETSDI